MAAGALLQQLQEALRLTACEALSRGLGDREEVQGPRTGGFGAGTAGANALEVLVRLHFAVKARLAFVEEQHAHDLEQLQAGPMLGSALDLHAEHTDVPGFAASWHGRSSGAMSS